MIVEDLRKEQMSRVYASNVGKTRVEDYMPRRRRPQPVVRERSPEEQIVEAILAENKAFNLANPGKSKRKTNPKKIRIEWRKMTKGKGLMSTGRK